MRVPVFSCICAGDHFHSVNPYESYYPCLCLSSTPPFPPPAAFLRILQSPWQQETRYALANLALISGRQIHCTSACIFLVAITKSRRSSCPPDRLSSAFFCFYVIMIPHPCSPARYAWQDNRSPYLPESPGVPCSYAHRQFLPMHTTPGTYTLRNHSY